MRVMHPPSVRVLGCVVLGLWAVAPLAAAKDAGPRAEPPVLPAEWLRAPPGEAQAVAIEKGAEWHGWPAMAGALRAGALAAYGRGDWANAEAWAATSGWVEIWASTEADEARRLREAREAAGEPLSASTPPPAPDRLLAERLGAAQRVLFLSDAAWSAEVFALLEPLDRRGEFLTLLGRLQERAPAMFAEFKALALALAVVHDEAPPSDWPHWQVKPEALPRRLAPAEEVFDHLAGLSRSGKALWRADRLDAAELRFAVDLALPAEERAWALERARRPLLRLAELYSMIEYRHDRIEAGAYVWTAPAYRLEDILSLGGICVDQAYFASQAGKALGAPTLLFSGAGREGRHAWFGYLGAGRKWFMDAGRDEAQNYVTGVAHDPQTWTEISDHELQFLSEGFRRERPAREARAHARFAAWLRADGRTREAEAAARAATRLERRTLAAWDELLALRPEPGEAREAVAREAAAGLTRYPDLQARYLGVAAESLRARGETAEADRLGVELARRFAGRRGDLSVKEIAARLERSMATESVERQERLYRGLLRQFGRGAGADLWDQIVRPYVAAHAKAGRWKEARAALALGRETLGAGYGSQLREEMRELDAALAREERAARAGQ